MLKALAVAAPEWAKRATGDVYSLSASVPFSLQNAIRGAAGSADAAQGAWADSNWATSGGRDSSVLLMRFWEEDKAKLKRMLEDLRPNIVLIGCMTLSFPGAIECARMARNMLGNEVAIILGGKHVTEILNRNAPSLDDSREWQNLAHACLCRGEQPLFDGLVSGEGEELVVGIGEAVAACCQRGLPANSFTRDLERSIIAKGGRWRMAFMDNAGLVRIVNSAIHVLDWSKIPTAPELFSSGKKFRVFDGAEATGHAYSDMGHGCIFDCSFCSERFSLNGKLRSHEHGIGRLVRHFSAIRKWCAEHQLRPSAFVEDSILLGANAKAMSVFAERLSDEELTFDFGIQLTVDRVLSNSSRNALLSLQNSGLSYVAFGMETINESVAASMSKNTGKAPWMERNLRALELLSKIGLKVGIFVLWGMGESADERKAHIETLGEWQGRLGQPSVVSLNWATRHPQTSYEVSGGLSAPYHEWATEPDDPRLSHLQTLFGEAAVNLALHEPIPDQRELANLTQMFGKLRLEN